MGSATSLLGPLGNALRHVVRNASVGTIGWSATVLLGPREMLCDTWSATLLLGLPVRNASVALPARGTSVGTLGDLMDKVAT